MEEAAQWNGKIFFPGEKCSYQKDEFKHMLFFSCRMQLKSESRSKQKGRVAAQHLPAKSPGQTARRWTRTRRGTHHPTAQERTQQAQTPAHHTGISSQKEGNGTLILQCAFFILLSASWCSQCPILNVWGHNGFPLPALLNSELLGGERGGGGFCDIQQAHKKECLLWRRVWKKKFFFFFGDTINAI